MISKEKIDEIREANDLVEVIGQYVTLSRNGREWRGLCPFHKEKTPSFHVRPDHGYYKCFGCGAGGDVLQFVQQIENMSFIESVRHLASRVNIDIREGQETAEEVFKRNERESLIEVVSWAQEFFHRQLYESEQGKSVGLTYLKERGIEEETIKTFMLGFAPDSYTTLTESAKKHGFSLEMLLAAGLTKERDGRHYDTFRNRIIFPIKNLSSKAIGFGGRALQKDNPAKYLNSPETPLYEKRKVLFGFSQARKPIRDSQKCFLVEGYLDLLSLYQRNVRNVVATCGTALTPEQAHLIAANAKQVTILYDGDTAGVKAADKAAPLLMAEGLAVRIVVLPDGQDPDDFSREHTSAEVQKHLQEHETDFVRYTANRLLSQPDLDPGAISQIAQQVIEVICHISDPLVRALHIRELSNRIGIDEGILLAKSHEVLALKQRQSKLAERRAERFETQQWPDQDRPKGVTREPSVSSYNDAISLALQSNPTLTHEREIVSLLINHGHEMVRMQDAQTGEEYRIPLADFIHDQIREKEIKFQDSSYDALLEEYYAILAEEQEPTKIIKLLTGHIDREISSHTIQLIADKYTLSRRWERELSSNFDQDQLLRRAVEHTFLAYQGRLLEVECRNLERKVRETSEVEEQLELMKQMRDLRAQSREIAYQLDRIHN